MKDATPPDSATRDEPAAKQKRPYRTPVVLSFGKLQLVTKGSGPNNGDGGQTMMVQSDRRLKTDIVRIGRHPLGFGLYVFDYLPTHAEACGHGRQFGVMADEVESVLPEAVAMHADGYRRVDYAMLGIVRPRR